MGNGFLTLDEQRAHFALWCLYKSPLLIGTDLRTLRPDSLGVLLAREVLAVHQDALGVAGDLVWKQGPKEVGWMHVCGRGWGCLARGEILRPRRVGF